MLPVAEVIRGWLPVVTGDAVAVRELSHGRRAALADATDATEAGPVAVLDQAGVAVAVARVQAGHLVPSIVLTDPHAVGSWAVLSGAATEEGS